MKTYTIILYSQYGEWSATNPFENRRDAERHADRYFRVREKDYCKGITFLEVILPPFPDQKELGDYSHDEEAD